MSQDSRKPQTTHTTDKSQQSGQGKFGGQTTDKSKTGGTQQAPLGGQKKEDIKKPMKPGEKF